MVMKKEIIDTTLRDGEQAPGVSFSLREKRDIAMKLMEAGVDEIEAGIPIMGMETIDFIRCLSAENSSTRISSWARLREDDMRAAYKAKSDLIHFTVPLSDYHLGRQIGYWDDVKAKMFRILMMAKDLFPYVSVGFQDSFRAPKDRLDEACSLAEELGIYRIRFSDTVGTALPSDVDALISRYRSAYSGVIDFHGHNDLGLAAANSLTALESGADSINVTMNGIGERAGNASLEQLAFILHFHKSLDTSISLNKIKQLSAMVSDFSGRSVAVDRPIVGELAFTHESGIHCHGQLGNPLAYQPFDPREKGLPPSSLVVGSHSGKAGVIGVLRAAGIRDSEKVVAGLMEAYRNRSRSKKNFLTQREVLEIYKDNKGRKNEYLR